MNKFLTGNPNLDLVILDKLDDRDLLNACQTNKKAQVICNDEEFWHRRYVRVYGEEYSFYKQIDRSWKNYYLLTLHYDEKYFPDRALIKVAKKGYIDLVKLFLSKGASGNETWTIALAGAAEHNHTDVIDFLLSNQRPTPHDDPIDFRTIVSGAAKGNQRNLLNRFVKNNDSPVLLSYVVHGAAAGRHRALMFEYLNLIIPSFNDRDFLRQTVSYWALCGAALGGDVELMKYFMDTYNIHDPHDILGVMDFAGEGGHFPAIEFLVSRGGEWEKAFLPAAENGHTELMKHLLPKMLIDENTYDHALFAAALGKGGHIDTVTWLAKLGARDFEDPYASLNIQKEMKKYLGELIVLRDHGELEEWLLQA